MPASVDRVPVPATANTPFRLASSKVRSALSVYNDTAGDMHVKVGPTPSTTSFTVKLVPGAFYELPAPYHTPDEITAVCSVIAGAAQVTEVPR